MSISKKDIFDKIRSISFQASEGTRLEHQLRKLSASLDIRRSNRGTNSITIDIRDSDDRELCIEADKRFISDMMAAAGAYVARCEEKLRDIGQAL